MVRIPKVTSLETAIKMYYENIEISNKEILQLFGKLGSKKVADMKKMAREVMIEDRIPSWNALHVNTQAAYKAWGLDIADLERRYQKLKKLGCHMS